MAFGCKVILLFLFRLLYSAFYINSSLKKNILTSRVCRYKFREIEQIHEIRIPRKLCPIRYIGIFTVKEVIDVHSSQTLCIATTPRIAKSKYLLKRKALYHE